MATWPMLSLPNDGITVENIKHGRNNFIIKAELLLETSGVNIPNSMGLVFGFGLNGEDRNLPMRANNAPAPATPIILRIGLNDVQTTALAPQRLWSVTLFFHQGLEVLPCPISTVPDAILTASDSSLSITRWRGELRSDCRAI